MPTIMDALEQVRNRKRDLDASRKEAANAFRRVRVKLGLSMQQVSKGAKVATATVHNVEQNKFWTLRTATKLARFYERAA